jgi:pimeloyl-ACP methyl ester carboxylesterase
MKENARITKIVRETGVVPPDVPKGLAALYPAYLGKFLHSELAVDPSAYAGRFAGPVLLVIGEKDAQVSPERDAKRLEAALKLRKQSDYRLVVVPGASHNLKAVESDSDAGFSGPVAPMALEAIRSWTALKLRKD